MVPIYAVDSFVSLRFKDAALYVDTLRDCYEGYALYLFLALMVGYLGDGDEYKVQTGPRYRCSIAERERERERGSGAVAKHLGAAPKALPILIVYQRFGRRHTTKSAKLLRCLVVMTF